MIGTQIGQLKITQQIGEGGFGVVYLARHVVLEKLFVVKVLLPRWSTDPEMVQRFINEARAASSIKHPSIIEVGDCGQLADGSWYMVLAYLEGGTLDGFLKSQGGPISMRLALQIMAPAAEALEAAHARQIVHCDLKPENIYLIRHENNPHHPVVLDFGIARMTEQMSGMRTTPGMIAGTLAYMAPEQIFDRRTVDRRSDVYAVAVILYQMVTGGWLPFQQRDAPGAFFELAPTAVYQLQKETAPIDPRARCGQIADGFASAILSALQYDPARRPQSLGAFMLLLAQAIPGDSFEVDGVQILKDFAPLLLHTTNLTETVRGAKPGAVVPAKPARYQLGEQLGEGGMAEVFRGSMLGAEGFWRAVAIKRIRPELSALPQFAKMFVQEAQIVARLHHPNLVTVIDFDHDADGRLMLVLEFVDGVDLHRLMESGPLPDAVIIFILLEVLRGLAYAHAFGTDGSILGIVHRDISPHNILLSWDGAVKVSDFGLAKPREATQASASLVLRGKPAYMSPEQIDGTRLDGRSDLFAVGIMFHEMLTGERLFWADDNRTTMARVLDRPIPRPSRKRRVSPDLEAVVMKLLERNPAARYATAEQAFAALAACKDASAGICLELMRLLSVRFPAQAAARRPSHPPKENAPAVPAVTVSAALRPEKAAAQSPRKATSVSMAVGEATADPPHPHARRRWLPGVLLGLGGSVAVIAFVVGRMQHERLSMESAATTPTPPHDTSSSFAAGSVAPVTSTTGVIAPGDAGVPDAAVRDAAILGAPPSSAVAPPVVPAPTAPSATTRSVRPATAAPAKAPQSPAAAPQRPRPEHADSDDVGGD